MNCSILLNKVGFREKAKQQTFNKPICSGIGNVQLVGRGDKKK